MLYHNCYIIAWGLCPSLGAFCPGLMSGVYVRGVMSKGGYVRLPEEANKLREDLRRMFSWSQDWQMLFNLEMCSVMHMGKRNKEFSLEMG